MLLKVTETATIRKLGYSHSIVSAVSLAISDIFNVKEWREYLRNGTRYRNSFNEVLTRTYALLKSVILNDLE